MNRLGVTIIIASACLAAMAWMVYQYPMESRMPYDGCQVVATAVPVPSGVIAPVPAFVVNWDNPGPANYWNMAFPAQVTPYWAAPTKKTLLRVNVAWSRAGAAGNAYVSVQDNGAELFRDSAPLPAAFISGHGQGMTFALSSADNITVVLYQNTGALMTATVTLEIVNVN